MPSLFFHRTTMAWLAFRSSLVSGSSSRLLSVGVDAGAAPSFTWFDAPRVCGKVLQLCYGEIFAMAAAGRKRDIAIGVMVTAKEQAEIRKAANKAAMPMSVYVRAKALEASRGAR